jgi:hypothetical protein
MSRQIAKVAVLMVLLTVFCTVSFAQYQLDYFPNLNKVDGQKVVVNTGYVSDAQGPGNLCDNIYVFNREQLLECCSCYVTPNGSRDFTSVNASFNSNNLTGSPVPTIIVKQVTSTAPFIFHDCDKASITITPDGSVFCPDDLGTPSCDPRKIGTHYSTNGLVAWAVKTQIIGSATGITETNSQSAFLSTPELLDLQEDCTGVLDFGTGQGVCSCGSFD